MNYWTNYQSYVAKPGLPIRVGQRINTNYGPGIITELYKQSGLGPWVVTIFVIEKNLAFTIGLSQITFGGGVNGELTSSASFDNAL